METSVGLFILQTSYSCNTAVAHKLCCPAWPLLSRPRPLPGPGALAQLVLYHQEVAEAMSEDAQLELVDWAARQLTALAGGRAGEALAAAAGGGGDCNTARSTEH